MPKKHFRVDYMKNENGSLLVEGLIALALLLIIVSAMVPLFTLSSKSSMNNKIQTVAYNVATEEIEKIKAMPYDSIGTVGGYPSGTLNRETDKTIEGIDFSITTDVRWQDDPSDGLVDDEEDPDGRDYKLVTVTLAWTGPLGNRELSLNTKIARQSEDQAFIGGNVKVVVKDLLDKPVENAQVTMYACPSSTSTVSGYTDSNGEFTFYALNPSVDTDDCTLTASKSGYVVQPGLELQSTTVLVCKTSTVTFIMERPGTLNVKLIDEDENEITTSSTITVGSACTSDTAYVNTDGGTFTLTDLYPGVWTVTPYAEGYETTGTVAANVNAAQLTVLTIKLSSIPPIPREFYIYDQDTSLPIDGALISVKHNGTKVTKLATTDSSGTAEVDLINGPYTITVSKSGYYGEPEDRYLSDSDTYISLSLAKAYLARFIVSDFNGDPIEDANVTLEKDSTSVTGATDSDGVFETYLLTGEWSVEISKTDYNTYSSTADVAATENSYPITLNDATYVSNFTVVDQDGYAVQNATVVLTKTGFSYTGTTNSSGLCSVELTKGTYSLDITKSEYIPNNSAVEIVNTGGNDFTKTLTAITYTSTFTVKNTSDVVLQGAAITLTSATGVEYTGTTNASGIYAFDIPAGNYTCLTTKTGYYDDSGTETIASGGSSINITLTPQPTYGAILVYARQRNWGWPATYSPKNDVPIRVTCSSPSYDTQINTGSGSNEDGYALFNNLTPATYTVRWGQWEWNWWEGWHLAWYNAYNLTVTAGNTTTYTYTFN